MSGSSSRYRLACLIAMALLVPRTSAAQRVEVLHSFTGCNPVCYGDPWPDDGSGPQSALVRGPDGFLYGTTTGVGGARGAGTIFKIAPTGAMTNLFTFRFYSSTPYGGLYPSGTLARGSDGAFYGGTACGGLYGDGILFKIATDGTFTKLHDFNFGDPTGDCNGGVGDLVQGLDGKFYGTVAGGGDFGLGIVFRLEADGSITTVHSFSGSDGQWPKTGLILASDGNMYGQTGAGGSGNASGCLYNGCGVIFRLTPDRGFSVLHAFDITEGVGPSTLIEGTDGSLYGTASHTAFKMALDGTFTVLHHFTNGEGLGPLGALVEGSDGNFYGTTSFGGAADLGTIFRLTPSGGVTVLHDFLGPEGGRPFAGLVQASDGNLYGTTYGGGTIDSFCGCGLGVVFRVLFPHADNGTFAAIEDIAHEGTLIATDPNSAPLTFSIVSNGTLGTATITDTTTGVFTYTPKPDANGADSFSFKATNGTIDSNVATMTVMIAPVNDAPVAVNGTASAIAGGTATGSLKATDVDNVSLTYVVVSNGAKGTAVITDAGTGAYTYTANPGTSGTDTFTFKANDGSLDSNPATITVTIAPGAACATNVSESVSVRGSAILRNRRTGHFIQAVMLINTGSGAISGPISLVLDDLTAGATLVGAAGATTCSPPVGSPYVNVAVGSDGILSRRELAIIILEFINPGARPPAYVARVLAGAGGR